MKSSCAGVLAYDRHSYANFVARHPPPTFLPQEKESKGYGYASLKSSVVLANAALHQACQYTTDLHSLQNCIGIGCASSLVSSDSSQNSKCFISLMDWNGSITSHDITFGFGEKRRSRREEDGLCGDLILYSLLQYMKEENDILLEDILKQDYGDAILTTHSSNDESISSIKQKTQEILNKNTDAVLALPFQKSEKIEMKPSHATSLPNDPLIFPGSFNPPHIGHVSLANAAIKTMKRIRHQERQTLLSSPLPTSLPTEIQSSITYHYTKHHPTPSAIFEMSITNADKPSLSVKEVERRCGLFASLANEEEMPMDWGVLFTSAPLFSNKVNVLQKYLPATFSKWSNEAEESKRKVTFVIGVDTFVRIINPKYYEDSYENMLEAVRDMGRKGVRYIVGGRLEQGKEQGEKSKFITGQEELSTLPNDVQGLFILIREEDFRVDISSTELRKQASSSSAMMDE